MLPYTPVHHLLARALGVPIVLTSANVSDEPIAYRDDEALARLHGIADAFLAPAPSTSGRTTAWCGPSAGLRSPSGAHGGTRPSRSSSPGRSRGRSWPAAPS